MSANDPQAQVARTKEAARHIQLDLLLRKLERPIQTYRVTKAQVVKPGPAEARNKAARQLDSARREILALLDQFQENRR